MSGVTAADFRQMGTQPDSKESFIAFDSTGNNVSGICGIFNTDVGIGSMVDDFVGDFSITFRTLTSDTAWKVVSEQDTSGKIILRSSIVMLSKASRILVTLLQKKADTLLASTV